VHKNLQKKQQKYNNLLHYEISLDQHNLITLESKKKVVLAIKSARKKPTSFEKICAINRAQIQEKKTRIFYFFDNNILTLGRFLFISNPQFVNFEQTSSTMV